MKNNLEKIQGLLANASGLLKELKEERTIDFDWVLGRTRRICKTFTKDCYNHPKCMEFLTCKGCEECQPKEPRGINPLKVSEIKRLDKLGLRDLKDKVNELINKINAVKNK